MAKWLKYIVPTLFIAGAIWAGAPHYDGGDGGGGVATTFLDGSAASPGLYPVSDNTAGFYYYNSGGHTGIGISTVGAAAWHIDDTQSLICDSAGAYLEVIGSGTNDATRLYSHGLLGQEAGADEAMTTRDTFVFGQSAHPLATVNTTGGDTLIAAGEGTTKVTIPAGHTCNAGDTVTLALNGTAGTTVATGKFTYGTDWCLAGCADNNAIAASLASEALATTGIDTYQSSNVVGFVRDNTASTKSIISVAASDAGCAVIANGTDGSVYLASSSILPYPSYGTSLGSSTNKFSSLYTNYVTIGSTLAVWGPSTYNIYALQLYTGFSSAAGNAYVLGSTFGGPVQYARGAFSDSTMYDNMRTGAYPYAWATVNNNGSSVIDSPGVGQKLIRIDDYTLCAGKVVNVWVDGTTTALTEGVDWTAATSIHATATSLASAIAAITGAYAVNSTVAVSVQSDDVTAYHRYTVSEVGTDGCMTITTNTDGTLQHWGDITMHPTNTYDIGATAATKPKVVYAGTGFDSDGDYYADGWYRVNTDETGLIQNTAGADIIMAPGRYTGTNQSGDLKLWGYPTYRAGTSAHIQADRYYIRSGAKPLTEGGAISILHISFPADTVSYTDLRVEWAMACYDGTDVKMAFGTTQTGAVQEADNTITPDAVVNTVTGQVESAGAAITTSTFTFTSGGANSVTLATDASWDCNFGGATTWYEMTWQATTNSGQYLTISAL